MVMCFLDQTVDRDKKNKDQWINNLIKGGEVY